MTYAKEQPMEQFFDGYVQFWFYSGGWHVNVYDKQYMPSSGKLYRIRIPVPVELAKEYEVSGEVKAEIGEPVSE